MRKPSETRNEVKTDNGVKAEGPRASGENETPVKTWPFAPGSQLGKQVAKPFKPKPSYRFNQR